MIGRGTWKTQNKILPGVYIRIVSDKEVIQGYTEQDDKPVLLADVNGVLLKTSDNKYLVVIVDTN